MMRFTKNLRFIKKKRRASANYFFKKCLQYFWLEFHRRTEKSLILINFKERKYPYFNPKFFKILLRYVLRWVTLVISFQII
jgi:hypothetical protein